MTVSSYYFVVDGRSDIPPEPPDFSFLKTRHFLAAILL
jgi:hypothetical protein